MKVPRVPRLAWRRWGATVAGLIALATAVAPAAESVAERVIILANSESATSVELARYYAAKRSVPEANIVALKMSGQETIGWSEFVSTIWQPLQDELVDRDWIDAINTAALDPVGRRKIAPFGHRISYLVVCQGVPLRISHDPRLQNRLLRANLRPQFRTNEAAVDSELALLAAPNPPVVAFLPNPLHRVDRPSTLVQGQVLKVSRLDGPTPKAARALIDRALVAERRGLLGRAYVDIGGIHKDGDAWFEAVVRDLETLGVDLDVDRTSKTFPSTARLDAPVLYFGWYAQNLQGPPALPGFEFPPGAVALHIHSHSARTLRSDTAGWTGPLVARGATATVGNVFEPYLQLTHVPSLLVKALLRGETWGDAAAYALPALSWQSIAVGDPLYRPFAVSLERQMASLGELDARETAFVVVRKARVLEAAAENAAALALLRETYQRMPSIPLALALAERLERAKDGAGAAEALRRAPLPATFAADEWGLARLWAQRLEASGAAERAVAVYRTLLAAKELPREFRILSLRDARRAAQAAKDSAQAAAWERALNELIAPAPEPKK